MSSLFDLIIFKPQPKNRPHLVDFTERFRVENKFHEVRDAFIQLPDKRVQNKIKRAQIIIIFMFLLSQETIHTIYSGDIRHSNFNKTSRGRRRRQERKFVQFRKRILIDRKGEEIKL